MINHNYKFKTKKYQEKYQNELDNISQNIKNIYKNRTDIHPIVSNYRKVFKITPARLKSLDMNSKDKIFVLYLLIHYTSVSDDTILDEFSITIDDLQSIKDDSTLAVLFADEIECFFNSLIEDYLANKKDVISFQEQIALGFDRDLS
ncbi:MAG: hypothetical protein WA945_10880 [Arcobacteraceae bacterium]